MGVSKAFTLYAADIDPITEANAVFIDQVQNFSLDTAIQNAILSGDGNVDPTYVSAMSQEPSITFGSTKLATILAENSAAFLINGIKVDSDGTHDGADFFFQQMAEGGVRAAGAAHTKLTVNEGLLVPQRITAQHGQVAQIDLACEIGYDGTNDPIVVAIDQALIGTPSVSEAFTLGPIKINGTFVDGAQSWAYDTGIQVVKLGGDGQAWPTYLAIQNRAPNFMWTCYDVELLNTYGITGVAQGATDSLFYLRKMTEGGTRVADATEEHIKLTVDEGKIQVQPITAQHGSVVGVQCLFVPAWDGSNNIVVVDTTAAIE